LVSRPLYIFPIQIIPEPYQFLRKPLLPKHCPAKPAPNIKYLFTDTSKTDFRDTQVQRNMQKVRLSKTVQIGFSKHKRGAERRGGQRLRQPWSGQRGVLLTSPFPLVSFLRAAPDVGSLSARRDCIKGSCSRCAETELIRLGRRGSSTKIIYLHWYNTKTICEQNTICSKPMY